MVGNWASNLGGPQQLAALQTHALDTSLVPLQMGQMNMGLLLLLQIFSVKLLRIWEEILILVRRPGTPIYL